MNIGPGGKCDADEIRYKIAWIGFLSSAYHVCVYVYVF